MDRTGGRGARLVAAAVAVAFLTLGCRPSPPPPAAVDGRPATNATSASLLPTGVFSLPAFDFEGFQRLMSELKGTPVIVNIWASWCPPCRHEAALLARAAASHGEQVQFLGVDILDNRSDAQAYLARYDVPYPSVFDASGQIRNRLGFIGIPETVFYDAGGTVAFVWTAPITADALHEGLRHVHVDSGGAPATPAPTSSPDDSNLIPANPYGAFHYANDVQRQAFQAFLRCAADHGVQYRGPFAPSNGKGILFGLAPGEEVTHAEQVEVSRHCPQMILGDFATPAGNVDEALFERTAIEFARCIRAHGYPGFPLPEFDDDDPYRSLEQLPFEWNSPRFTAAMNACIDPVREYVFAS